MSRPREIQSVIRFQGESYLHMDDAPLGEEFTVAFWVRWFEPLSGDDFSSGVPSPDQAVLMSFNPDDDEGGLRFTVGVPRRVEVSTGVSTRGAGFGIVDTDDQGQPRWHLLAFTLRPATGTRYELVSFLDGERVSTETLNHDSGERLPARGPLTLGRRSRDSGDDQFSGEMALFGIWPRALDDGEIANLFDGQRIGNTALFWSLDALPAVEHRNVSVVPLAEPAPLPGHVVIRVDTSQASSRRVTVLNNGPALGTEFGPGTYRIDVQGLGALRLVVDTNGVEINGQRWLGERELTVFVREVGSFVTSEPRIDGPVEIPLEVDIPEEDAGITSRSVLTEDYRADMTPHPVYRSTITLPLGVESVDLFCEGGRFGNTTVEVEVDGQTLQLRSDRPQTVRPDNLSKLIVTTPATELGTPALHLRTDQMTTGERVVVCPDVLAHRRIAALEPGTLAANRSMLGIDAGHTDEDCAAVQSALQNVAKTVQYTYNRQGGGLHHDRFVSPARMEHPHWMLQMDGMRRTFRPLTPEEVATHTQGARKMDAQPGLGFFDDLANAFEEATSVIVHTAERVTRDVVHTVESLGEDALRSAEKIGDDIVHGDLKGAFRDFGEGVVNETLDVLQGGESVGGDLIEGARQIVVITLQTASGLVQFVLDHTGIIGQFLRSLLDGIGAAVGGLIRLILSAFGWDEVIRTQDALIDAFETALDGAERLLNDTLRPEIRRFFETTRHQLEAPIDRLIQQFGGSSSQLRSAATDSPSYPEAVERLEWLLSKAFGGASGGATNLALGSEHDPLMDILTRIEERLESDRDLQGAVARIRSELGAVLQDPDQAPERIVVVFLELVKVVIDVAIDLFEAVADLVLDLFLAGIRLLRQVATAPLDLPFFSALFSAIDDSKELNMLNLATLLIATPATIISNLAIGRPPFGGGARLAALTPADQAQAQDWGIVYGSCQIVDGVLSAIVDPTALANEIVSDLTRNEGFKLVKISPAALNAVLGADLVVLFLAQLAGSPGGAPSRVEAPRAGETAQILTLTLWVYQWVQWVLDLAAGIAGFRKREEGTRVLTPIRFAGEYGPATNTLLELIHLALFAALAGVEGNSGAAAHRRTATYILDPFKGILEIGLDKRVAEATFLLSIPAVAISDVIFQSIYGGIYLARAAEGDLA